jgi:hypothetical protein
MKPKNYKVRLKPIVHTYYRKNKNNKVPHPVHFSITFQGSTATDNQREQEPNPVLTPATCDGGEFHNYKNHLSNTNEELTYLQKIRSTGNFIA